MSLFANVPVAPPDAILSLATNYKEDKDPRKVNLGIGAYRTEEGKPWPLPSVKRAERIILNDPNEDKEYVPIDGKPENKRPVQELIFSKAELDKGTVATAQTLSGTGSLQLIGQFLKNFVNCNKIHLPDPTWGNHPAIFKRAGLESAKFTYYHPPTRGFDFHGMVAALSAIPSGDAVLLHACAQNPTGVDPSPEQWQTIIAVIKERGIIPVLDNAYQGYASGDLEKDGLSQRLFEDSGLEYFISQSFAKNFGLYGERIGYVHVRCADQAMATAVLSQMKILIRQAYSSPPRHGASIVYTILSNPELKAQWLEELKFMASRIDGMRGALRGALEAKDTPGTWNHITDQIGMFSFTGLDMHQVERMISDFHIYMTKDGRISMAGVNPGNVDYVAECINQVVRPPVMGFQVMGSQVMGTQVMQFQQPDRFTVPPHVFERIRRGEQVPETEVRGLSMTMNGMTTPAPASVVVAAQQAPADPVLLLPAEEKTEKKKKKSSKTAKVSKAKSRGCC